jgi:hypothetical protein
MPKQTKRDFYVVDLIRKRNFVNLEVPPIRVNVSITVEADVPKAKMDRLEKAARESLDKTETIVTEVLNKHEKMCADFVAQQKWKEAMQAATQVEPLIKNAEKIAQINALDAVEKAKKAEAQGDKLLLEARVKVVVFFVLSAVKIATSVARIGASHGGDIHAWLSLGKGLIKVGLEIQQQLKDEPKLKQDVIAGIEAYLNLRQTTIMEKAKEQGLTGTLPDFPEVIVFVAKGVVNVTKAISPQDVADFVVKKIKTQVSDAEKARKAYREHTTKMRQKVDSVSAQGDKLFAEMKKQTTLKEGVKIGAECMQIRGKATRLGQALDEALKFLEASQTTMEQFGLKCDNKTIFQKVKALDTKTIFSECSGIVESVMAVKDLVDAVS